MSELKKFQSKNKSLTSVQLGKILSKNDIVSLVQLPKDFDPNLLLGQIIEENEKTKLTINNVKYIVKPKEDQEELLILDRKLHKVQILSKLVLRKKHKKQTNHDEELNGHANEPNNNEVIEVDSDATEKMKKKRKKENTNFSDEEIFQILKNLSNDLEKKANSKRKLTEEQTSNNILDSLNSVESPKKTKVSAPVILDNILLNPAEKPKRTRRAKQNKESQSVSNANLTRSSYEDTIDYVVKHFVPKDKDEGNVENNKKSYVNSSVMSEMQSPKFSVDISHIPRNDESVMKKKRKNAVKKLEQNNETTGRKRTLSESDKKALLQNIISSLQTFIDSES